MTASVDLELIRAATLMDSDPAAAAGAAASILGRHPDSDGAALLFATACRRIGDSGAAVRVLEPLVAALPNSAAVLLEFGRALAADLQADRAMKVIERALELDATFADAWQELSRLRFRMGDERGGDLAYLEYARRSEQPPELADAAVAIAEARLDTAERLLQGHLAVRPRDVHAIRMLAEVAFERQDYPAAETALRQCLDLEPGYGAARYDLARVLNAQQESAEALALLERLLGVEPESRAFLMLKSQALRFADRFDEAIALLERILEGDPRDVASWILLGGVLIEVGRQAQAIEAYRRAIAVDPASGDAYWSLANLKTFRFSEADVLAMQGAISSAAALGSNRMKLEFALGKALEDAGAYEASFRHYLRGNSIFRGGVDYDPAPMEEDVRRSEATFTPRFFSERSGWGLQNVDPIFIVGVPRSGSTLIEQILASHSQVEGTRELVYLSKLVREMAVEAQKSRGSIYPESLADMPREKIERLGQRYLELAGAHRPLGKPRFVDKMLNNFGHVGLIQIMFPNATILDARRHPMACGFSCFKQIFGRGLAFTCNLEEMGRYWRCYHELMAHADAVLPGRVYRVHYERLIAEPEAEVRRILDHCGLSFEQQCLRFYETTRAVMTVSSEQVRRPIYSESLHQWKHFEPWLGPLAEALGPLVAEYPEFGTPAG